MKMSKIDVLETAMLSIRELIRMIFSAIINRENLSGVASVSSNDQRTVVVDWIYLVTSFGSFSKRQAVHAFWSLEAHDFIP